MQQVTFMLAALAVLTFNLKTADGSVFFKPKHWHNYKKIELKSEKVDVEITNGVASVTVQDHFYNNSSGMIEGDLIMPLPEDTVVTDMSIIINGKEVKGEILDKNKAKNIYQTIVRKMKDPLLAEWAGKNLLRIRLFPIPAHSSQQVRVFFTTVLPLDNNLYKFTYMLKQVKGWKAQAATQYTFTVNLTSDIPIRTVYSPTHKIYVKKKGENKAHVSFEGKALDTSKNFELFYSISKKNIDFGLLTYKKVKKDGYFMMMFKPRDPKKGKRKPVKMIMIMDTSGSMSGDKIKNAKKALTYSLERLKEDDLFNIINP